MGRSVALPGESFLINPLFPPRGSSGWCCDVAKVEALKVRFNF